MIQLFCSNVPIKRKRRIENDTLMIPIMIHKTCSETTIMKDNDMIVIIIGPIIHMGITKTSTGIIILDKEVEAVIDREVEADAVIDRKVDRQETEIGGGTMVMTVAADAKEGPCLQKEDLLDVVMTIMYGDSVPKSVWLWRRMIAEGEN